MKKIIMMLFVSVIACQVLAQPGEKPPLPPPPPPVEVMEMAPPPPPLPPIPPKEMTEPIPACPPLPPTPPKKVKAGKEKIKASQPSGEKVGEGAAKFIL